METPLHAVNVEPQEAARIQSSLGARRVAEWDGRRLTTIAGADVHHRGGQAVASIIVLSFPELLPVDTARSTLSVAFPYVPGLLAFREGPAILIAWRQLRVQPDLRMLDGQRRVHPRGFGLASHMGLWLGRPGIGVAKSRLYDRHGAVGLMPGDSTELWDEKAPAQIIGLLLRTQRTVDPIYVSVGHLIDLDHAVEFVLRCLGRHRLPEPCRLAREAARSQQSSPQREFPDLIYRFGFPCARGTGRVGISMPCSGAHFGGSPVRFLTPGRFVPGGQVHHSWGAGNNRQDRQGFHRVADPILQME